MKKYFIVFLLMFSFGSSDLLAANRKKNNGEDVWVSPHTRSNGTFVQGHYRSAPDHSAKNNWSTFPNTNKYTGEVGKKKYEKDETFSSTNESSVEDGCEGGFSEEYFISTKAISDSMIKKDEPLFRFKNFSIQKEEVVISATLGSIIGLVIWISSK